MFFLSQKNVDMGEEIQKSNSEEQIKNYERLVEELGDSMSIYIHKEGPYPDDVGEAEQIEKKVINYQEILEWSQQDWAELDKVFEEKENWFVVFIARGGMILLDDIESKIDNFIISYIKPKVGKKRAHEDRGIYKEFTDPNLEDKLAEFSRQKMNLLLVEDIVEDGLYIEAVLDQISELAEDLEIEIEDTAVLALLTRHRQIGQAPVYGTLIDYSGEIYRDWGNDFEDGLDEYDFSNEKESIDDLM